MLISAADYQRMAAADIFENKPKVELIDGEIYTINSVSRIIGVPDIVQSIHN